MDRFYVSAVIVAPEIPSEHGIIVLISPDIINLIIEQRDQIRLNYLLKILLVFHEKS